MMASEKTTRVNTLGKLFLLIMLTAVFCLGGQESACRVQAAQAVTYEVNYSYLNVRSGPGTSYDKLGTLNDGDKIVIKSTRDGWGCFTYNGQTGWVKLSYLKTASDGQNSSEKTSSEKTSSEKTSAAKTSTETSEYNYVVTNSFLNVRTGAGTSYSKAGTLYEGDKIYVLQVTNGWGRIKYNGKTCYISMSYVAKPQEVKQKESSAKTKTETAASTAASSTAAASTAASTVKACEYQVTYTFVNVRSDKSSSSRKLGTLDKGTKVTVTEVSGDWGKITYQGQTAWICLDYAAKVNASATGSSSATTSASASTSTSASASASASTSTSASTAKVIGTYQITADYISVRKGAGATYTELGKLYKGSVVKITEIQNNSWGRFSFNGKDGWINCGYCKKVSYTTAVKLITTQKTASTASNAATSGTTAASGTAAASHKNEWYFTDGKWVYYNASGKAAFTSDAMYCAWKEIKSKSSPTSYYIVVNTSVSKVFVFKGSAGSWTPYKLMNCSCGKSSTPTKKGLFSVGNKGYSFGSSTYTCYYYTQFSGHYLFHSVLYEHNSFKLLDSRLGANYSHGCVRMSLANAKWIYDYMPTGTRVYVY